MGAHKVTQFSRRSSTSPQSFLGIISSSLSLALYFFGLCTPPLVLFIYECIKSDSLSYSAVSQGR